MSELDVIYTGDLRCATTYGPSRSVLMTDAPVDKHGKGETFSPTDLVATALGSCLLTMMGMQARVYNIDFTGAHAQVQKTMSSKPPRRIARLVANIVVPHEVAVNFDEKQRRELETAAEHCPVKSSLAAEIEVPVTFTWE